MACFNIYTRALSFKYAMTKKRSSSRLADVASRVVGAVTRSAAARSLSAGVAAAALRTMRDASSHRTRSVSRGRPGSSKSATMKKKKHVALIVDGLHDKLVRKNITIHMKKQHKNVKYGNVLNYSESGSNIWNGNSGQQAVNIVGYAFNQSQLITSSGSPVQIGTGWYSLFTDQIGSATQAVGIVTADAALPTPTQDTIFVKNLQYDFEIANMSNLNQEIELYVYQHKGVNGSNCQGMWIDGLNNNNIASGANQAQPDIATDTTLTVGNTIITTIGQKPSGKELRYGATLLEKVRMDLSPGSNVQLNFHVIANQLFDLNTVTRGIGYTPSTLMFMLVQRGAVVGASTGLPTANIVTTGSTEVGVVWRRTYKVCIPIAKKKVGNASINSVVTGLTLANEKLINIVDVVDTLKEEL